MNSSSKKNIVLFTTRPITSKYTKSLIEQMCILKPYQEQGYGIIFVTPKSEDRNAKYIEEVAGIRIDSMISYKEHYLNEVFTKKYKNWNEYVEKVFLFSNLENVSEIVIFGGILSDATGLTREKNRANKLMGTWQQMNFTANGSYMSGMFQLIKLSRERKIPLHEICFDPCENSLSQMSYKPYKYYCYHGYDWPNYNLERLDSLQEYLLNRESFFLSNEKTLDLCFGFTALTIHRENQYDVVMDALDHCTSNLKKKIFVRNKKLGIDTFVKRDEYLEHIRSSRYTLIMPPYDPYHFSIYRFLESIHNDCLPLVTVDTNTIDFMNTFNIDRDIMNEITISYSEIGQKIIEMNESRRLELIEYFKDKCMKVEKKLHIEEYL